MNSKKLLISLVTASSLILSSVGNVFACTALIVTDINGNAYHGRTLEFSFAFPTMMTYFPAGTKIESVTPTGAQGVTFNTKYSILAQTSAVVPGAKQPLVAEGTNDQGLSFSANEMNGQSAPPVGKDASKILSVNDFGTWILGNFKTVAELKAAMLSDNTEFWLPVIQALGGVETPLHYAIFDKRGNGLVVEFINGKKNVYDNPANVLTNAPEFPWHLTNLNNYTFNNINKNTGQLGSLKLQTADAGIALTALPSAQTATGRFVKAAFYANYVRKGKTPDESINLLAHIMNNFDRPHDLTIDPPGGVGDGPRGKTNSTESTQWTVMNDLSRNLSYIRSINAINWTVIDMNKLKNVTQIKSVSSYDVDKAGADAFNLFYK
ncbi:linear amide C-N hydrolase [Polynucleobacter sp. CS-Odin-A6]|uniref:linear amide C-N hydrolase n=1 Tax=Polynucleobacter sp. CS-Odin-A6 TaxID=2689106 RepID=UPI001C0DCBB0|nr:linear amide C-N hydrolase [Polynucleobacter sp. CS-Odin-A6]MBU3622005.1 linear amide C-N hydrolase [Polynucleobacter sp. CS-Odin-A6]